VTIPIPGNDDSFQCINFYCYLVSKLIISKKFYFFHYRWKKQLKEERKRKRKVVKKNLYYSYWINKYYTNVNKLDDNLKSIVSILKNTDIVVKRSITEYESLFRSFVKTDMVFTWKNF
jgi:16S rRNA C1402 (ribose-2'-O) methylase RsmI